MKDRRSLTGADVDTSAVALHHLPFTGHANRVVSVSLTLSSSGAAGTRMLNTAVTPHVWERKREGLEISRGYTALRPKSEDMGDITTSCILFI